MSWLSNTNFAFSGYFANPYQSQDVKVDHEDDSLAEVERFGAQGSKKYKIDTLPSAGGIQGEPSAQGYHIDFAAIKHWLDGEPALANPPLLTTEDFNNGQLMRPPSFADELDDIDFEALRFQLGIDDGNPQGKAPDAGLDQHTVASCGVDGTWNAGVKPSEQDEAVYARMDKEEQEKKMVEEDKERETQQQQQQQQQQPAPKQEPPVVFREAAKVKQGFTTPQQTKGNDKNFRPGSLATNVNQEMPEYSFAKQDNVAFLCLEHGGIPLFVRKSQLALRLDWNTMTARYPSTPYVPIDKSTLPTEKKARDAALRKIAKKRTAIGGQKTMLELAYEADHRFKGGAPTEEEVKALPVAPLQVFDATGDPVSMPSAWLINKLSPPKASFVEDQNPFGWYVRQCLNWSRIVKDVAAGKGGLVERQPTDMFFRYRANEDLHGKQVRITFHECLKPQFVTLGKDPAVWLKANFLLPRDPSERLDLKVLQSGGGYHVTGPIDEGYEVPTGEGPFKVWSTHPRDLYRTWMKKVDVEALSTTRDYKSFPNITAAGIYDDIKGILNDGVTSLRGAMSDTSTCVAEPKYSSAGKREGDQASKMNKVSATTVAAAIYKEEKAQRDTWEDMAEWLHRSGFQMGGFGAEVFYHDPQSSQLRSNFIFGTKNANTCMLRYETWARRFTANWHVNEYSDSSKKAPNFGLLAASHDVIASDQATFNASNKQDPTSASYKEKLGKRLDKPYARDLADADSTGIFKNLNLTERHAWIRSQGEKAARKPTRKTQQQRDEAKKMGQCLSTAQDIPHSHLVTKRTAKSEAFVMDLYSRWYDEHAPPRFEKHKIKIETEEAELNFWPTKTYQPDKMDPDVLAYHIRQANYRFGWIIPQLQWIFTGFWTDRTTGVVEEIKVDTTFDVFSRTLPFRIEVKLDGEVDELWASMKMG